MSSYQSDYNEYFVGNYPRVNGTSDGSWPKLFIEYQYINNISFFICPGNKGRIPVDDGAGGPLLSHYGYNYFHIGGSSRYTENDSSIPARLTQLRNISKIVIMVDNKSPGDLLESRCRVNDSDDTSQAYGLAFPWHQRAINTLWGDSHVSSVKAISSAEAYTTPVFGRKTNYLSKWKRTPE